MATYMLLPEECAGVSLAGNYKISIPDTLNVSCEQKQFSTRSYLFNFKRLAVDIVTQPRVSSWFSTFPISNVSKLLPYDSLSDFINMLLLKLISHAANRYVWQKFLSCNNVAVFVIVATEREPPDYPWEYFLEYNERRYLSARSSSQKPQRQSAIRLCRTREEGTKED